VPVEDSAGCRELFGEDSPLRCGRQELAVTVGSYKGHAVQLMSLGKDWDALHGLDGVLEDIEARGRYPECVGT
jgi:hypothetical protein